MMNRFALIAVWVSMSMLTPSASSAEPATGKPRHARLDSNGDGSIDRKEAEAAPRLSQHFDQLDKNKDGRIDAGERPERRMRDGKQGQGGHEGMRGRKPGMRDIAQADLNGDGRLSRGELAGRERALKDFDNIDRNRDGLLTRGELREHGNKMRVERAARGREHFDKRFKAADTDGDGRLSRSEAGKFGRGNKGFAWMDENGDGFLGRDELRPRREGRDDQFLRDAKKR